MACYPNCRVGFITCARMQKHGNFENWKKYGTRNGTRNGAEVRT